MAESAWKVPSPFPRRTTIWLSLQETRSGFPSPLKSPVRFEQGPRLSRTLVKPTVDTGLVMSKRAGGEVEPPGLATVIIAVPADVISVAGMVTVSCELLTNVVVRGCAFQLATAPETKPVPFIVRVNCPPPAAAFVGTSGFWISGILLKFGCPWRGIAWKSKNERSKRLSATAKIFIIW